MKLARVVVYFLLLCGVLPAVADPVAHSGKRSAAIMISEDAPPPIQFGAQELQVALEKKPGFRVRVGAKLSSDDISILLHQKSEKTSAGSRASDSPESFSLAIHSRNLIIVEGSDAVGTMYGALELAEQIEAARGTELLDQIKAVTKTPFLSLRGVNQFLTVQDMDSANGAFWSDTFWHDYLDMLARDRYNLLDIHGPVDAVTLSFPNGFSYFVSLPDFPQVGVGPEKARMNMERLRQVIHMAANRGIKVAYMNYEAPPPIGPWKTRKFMEDERWTANDQEFFTGPQLEEYTREGVASFLKQLPELWMFGFRIGESGQPEDFYKRTYLAALKDTPESLNLYVRTWGADPAKVRELAASTPHKLYIEPKYNGEQLGSPYQAVMGPRDYAASGSYENYTNYPRNFSILWQIRAHGTHRVFFWGSPEFARRTVRSCKFGNGVGFSMEPMDAYNPARDYLHNNPEVKHDFYPWMYQREWLWHMLWGRAAFDPEVSNQVFVAEFVRRFGEEVGPATYKSIIESSKIVPFIYSYHTVGLDHQEFAPEFETGDAWLESAWTGDRVVSLGGNNQNFLTVQPMDRTAMADPATFVDLRLKQQPSGKMSPWEAADYLDTAAEAAELAIKEAEKQPSGNPEFDCLRRDVEALTALGRYYAARIRSVTHLEFYNRTGQHDELTASYRDLQKAIAHWDRLSQIADEHFGFVPELIRMGVNQFRWKEEGRTLALDLDQINKLEMDYAKLTQSWRQPSFFGHVPPFKAKPGQPLVLNVSLPSSRSPHGVSLFYRNSHQVGYTELPMRLRSKSTWTWSATVPPVSLIPGSLEYYFEIQPLQGDTYRTMSRGVPYRVFVNDNDAKPVVRHREPGNGVTGDSVALEIEVRSDARVRSARVFYKAIPSYHEWVPLAMGNAGGDRYRAQVPLTPEGILYYFEVIDEDGNAANYPNFLERTPYFVIDSRGKAANEDALSGRQR